jgi:UPF0271 protein
VRAVGSQIDLSADVGEWDEPGPAPDFALLAVVTTVHIACGFHAGGPEVMRRTAARAIAAGVAVGAHPSYPDRAGFGRRPLDRPAALVVDDVLYQIGALDALVRAEGGRVASVKPHGALYNRLAGDETCAALVARALLALDPGLRLVLPAGSPAVGAARSAGARVVPEAFCDRAYRPDGSLAARDTPGAVVSDPETAAGRAVRLALDGQVRSVDGSDLRLVPETLCVHGDTPGAFAVARAVRDALAGAGVHVAAPAT